MQGDKRALFSGRRACLRQTPSLNIFYLHLDQQKFVAQGRRKAAKVGGK